MSARRRGLLRLSVLLVAVAGVVVLVARSQGGSSGGEQGGMPTVTDSTPAKPTPVRLVARTSPQHLPAPISGEAAVASRDGVLSIGGLDSNTASTSSVVELRPPDGKARAAGSLVEPLHDAAAAAIAGETLVFGGGSASTIDSVESLARRGTSSIVGHLPVPRSDLSAATVGERAYVLGGYDGSVPVGDVSNGRRTQLQADRVTAHAGPLRGGRATGPRDLRVRRRDREWPGLGRDPGGRHRQTAPA